MTESNPADAIIAHHAKMLCELQARVDDLIGAVGLGESTQAQTVAIRDYIDTIIIPHAAAEEKEIYAAARDHERRLIDSLVLEHQALRRVADQLTSASTDTERAVAAGTFAELFGIHAAKENEFVLPAILEEPSLDLKEILKRMHVAFENERAAVTEEVDVRQWPHARRHDEIFSRLQKLSSGEALVIVNDHDPKPLRYQMEAIWPAAFAWTYEESGPEQWKVAVARR